MSIRIWPTMALAQANANKTAASPLTWDPVNHLLSRCTFGPTSADLDPKANGLGATYEEAWLACRFLGQAYGEARLIAFYRAVSGGDPQKRAFRRVLGTTEATFVRRWRADLTGLAHVAG